MHWGHATSKDLVHWQQQPIALYPDSLGYIFSGSVVVDKTNSSGLGRNGQIPLVAIFTEHDPVGEKEKRTNFQNESIAYSLDEGKTWKKYAANPVLKNPGIPDFRDPKVRWFGPAHKWIMSLATHDHITFFSSPDLKNWTKESEFGQDVGAHGGVWECPDLFPMNDNGRQVWALLVSINPGGPNGGSCTQYFLGDFDGHRFTPYSTQTKWVDYGPDDYAGVTWSNTGDEVLFLGWMSNWLYADRVPTSPWRGAMTFPRRLALQHAGADLFLCSKPVESLQEIRTAGTLKDISGPCQLELQLPTAASFTILLSNEGSDTLTLGYDAVKNEYFIDRTRAGLTGFAREFPGRYTAPRLRKEGPVTLTLLLDQASLELFADGGLTVMTAIDFPRSPYTHISTESTGDSPVIKCFKLKSIWK